ncbi:Dps family protein [Planctomicrobium sp. SH668]|uniref:Dps family protein n=1 Tax=Planctomicrobium sp. SH668 TaxID=3448126 RepID=UPI003F5BA36B
MAKNKSSAKGSKVPSQLSTPTDLSAEGVAAICEELRALLADAFALYVKTKNFHWHLSGPHFRDYHLLLDEQAEQIFGMTDDLAERARKIGGTSLRSIGQIAKYQRIKDNDEEFVSASEMLKELAEDNAQVVRALREAHEICDEHGDIATASLIENWVDEGERRTWFLFESIQPE